MIKREEIKPDNGRVTAGIPSLDSPKRSAFERDTVYLEHAKALEHEWRSNEESCLAPDAERPSTILGASEGIRLTPAQFMQHFPGLWFERSETVPTEMMCCVRVPVSEDHPKGLWYQFGFSAERPLIEWNWSHEKTRVVHTRIPGFLKEEKYACHGCPECRKLGAFFGRIRGWRSLLQILIDNKVITRTEAIDKFGATGISRNWQMVMHGS